jgi:hypothetical protein
VLTNHATFQLNARNDLSILNGFYTPHKPKRLKQPLHLPKTLFKRLSSTKPKGKAFVLFKNWNQTANPSGKSLKLNQQWSLLCGLPIKRQH